MVGNRREALEVLEGMHTSFAQGTSREVFRIGDVVYKLNLSPEIYDDNEYEWENYQHVITLDLDPRIRIPRMSFFKFDNADSVVAMDYIEGQPMAECWCYIPHEPHGDNCLRGEMLDVVQNYIGDTGGENVIFDGEFYWLIDFG